MARGTIRQAEEQQAADSNIIETTVQRVLRVDLSPEERAAAENECARLTVEIDQIEKEKKEADADWNNALKPLKRSRSEAARQWQEGVQERPVDCRVTKDYTHNMIEVWRMDSDPPVCIEWPRAMTAEESQVEIPEAAKPDKAN